MEKKWDELSDEDLMELYQKGEEAAFNRLYLRYSDRVYGYLRKRIRDTRAANDVFQASFLKLHRSRLLFNSSFLFAPWLFAVVRSVLLDWQKDSRNKVIYIEFEDSIAAPTSDDPVLTRNDVASLPEAQRLAVEMRYFDDLSFEEIAVRLDTTSGNARQLVSRGLKALKALFTSASISAKGGSK